MKTCGSYQGQRENNERTTFVADREASAYSNPWSSQWPSTNTQVELIDTCTDSSNIRNKRDSLIRKETVERTGFLEFLEKVLESSIFFGDSFLILTKSGTVSKHERNSDIFTLV